MADLRGRQILQEYDNLITMGDNGFEDGEGNAFEVGFVSVKWFGALGNGSNDDLSAINSAIEYADDNNIGVVVFPKPATHYSISGTILIPSGMKLVGSGRECLIKLANSSDASAMSNEDTVSGNENISISSMTIDGNGSNQSPGSTEPGGACLELYNVDHFEVRDVSCINAHRHAFDFSNSTHGRVERCYASGFGDDGFTTHYSSDVVFDSCFAEDGSETFTTNSNGFEADDGSVRISYINCETDNCSAGFQAKTHEEEDPVSDIEFIGCRARNSKWLGFDVRDEFDNFPTNFKLIGCSVFSVSTRELVSIPPGGISLVGVRDVFISDCYIDNNGDGGDTGIRLDGCSRVKISGCRIDNQDLMGIQLTGTSNQVQILSGFIDANGDRGIQMAGSSQVLISGVEITNGATGIKVTSTGTPEMINIQSNIIKSFTTGVDLDNSSLTRTRVIDNLFRSNTTDVDSDASASFTEDRNSSS